MKKIILILFMFLSVPVFAKEEIYQVGAFYSYDYDGYTFIGGRLNPNEEGDYFLDYKDRFNNFYKREVKVRTLKTLKSGLNINLANRKVELNDEYRYAFKGSIRVGNYDILYGEVFIEDDYNQHIISPNNAFYMVLDGEEIVNYYVYPNYSYSAKMISDGDFLYWLIGYEDYDHVNLSLLSINMNNARAIHKEVYSVKSSKDDYPRDMIKTEEGLFIFMDSSFYSQDYSKVTIVMLDSNFGEQKLLTFGNNNINKLYSLVSDNLFFYLLVNTSGSLGVFSNDGTKIVKVSKELEIKKYIVVNNLQSVLGMYELGEDLAYLSSNKNKLKISLYNKELFCVKNVEEETTSGDYFDNAFSNGKSLYLNLRDGNNKYYYGEYFGDSFILNQDKTLRANFVLEDFIYFTQNEFLLEMTDYHISYTDNKYYLNGELMAFKDVQNTYTSEQMYGLNYAISKFENDYLVLCIINHFYIPLDANIEDGRTYPVGFTLDSNANIEIDGKMYGNCYEFNEAGEYKVILHGQSDLKTMTITITDGYESHKTFESCDVSAAIEEGKNNYTQKEIDTYYYLEKENSNGELSISIAIICVSIVALISIFIPIRRKKND